MKRQVIIPTKDDIAISATLFTPTEPAKAGIVINSATAVKQSYYESIADFLSKQGFLVMTYDYRGIGRSAISNSRDKRLTMQAWGERDLVAVIDWLKLEHSALDWHCIGHSVGGQILGFAENNTFFKSVYCVSAQSGYWNHWQGFKKPRMFAMWHAVVPGLSILLGKVPGVFLGGESLPEGIARQWAYWGRHKNYIVDPAGRPIREGFERMQCNMKFLLIDDDLDFAPPAAVHALESYYSSAHSTIEVIRAKEHSSRPIGHFGFFRKEHENGLWHHLLEWMNINS
jgi:predicted alpha/beta hydrolase